MIAFNTADGVLVGQSPTDASTGNAILSNSIYGNAGIGIDLGGNGVLPNHSSPTTGIIAGTPNGDQNYAVFTSAIFVPDTSDPDGTLTVTGSGGGDPYTNYFVQVFANPAADPTGYGQGQTLIGTMIVSLGGSGTVSGSLTFTTANLTGEVISATTTNMNGDTSEFSQDLTVINASASSVAGPIVTNPATEQTLLQSLVSELQDLPTGTTLPTVVLQPSNTLQLDAVVAAIDGLTCQPTPVVTVEIDLGGQSLLANSSLVPPAGVEVVVQNGTLASTRYVDSSNTNASPNGLQANPFATIQAALGAAGPGDVIVVATGNGYNESDTVSISNLTVEGVGAVLDGQEGPQQSPGFTVAADGVTISGFTIQNYEYSPAVVVSGGSLTLDDDTIADNSNESSGGGILNEGILTLENCTIADNKAASGGGISDEGTLTAVNTTIADNTVSGLAGAGGGLLVFGDGTATLYNTIVAENTDSAGGDDVGGAGITMASSNNMVGYDDSGTVAASTDPIVLGGASADLGLLASNGGQTQTIALLAGSRAIDAGSNTWADAYGVTTDERGAVRGGQPDAVEAGSTVDIGAYEASSSYLVTTTADSTAIGTLRSAILWADVSTNANPENLASPAASTIDFDIPASDPDYSAATNSWTITPTTPLPAISASTTINGYSQPGFGPDTPVLVLSGREAGQGSDGLDLTADRISIFGLLINGFGGDGFDIASSDNTLQCVNVGYAATYISAVPDGVGIYITGADNLIGTDGQDGTFQDVDVEGDYISGNLGPGIWLSGPGATGNVIAAGGFIANGGAGLLIDAGASDNWIGVNSVYGPASPDDSVYFASNSGPGIEISGAETTGNVVAGNTITGNGTDGVLIDDGASGNWIGINPSSGSDYALEVNTINSNTAAGVEISGLGTTGNVVAGSMMNANGTDGALIDNGASNNWIGLGPQEEPGGSLQGTSPFGSGMPLMGDVLNGDGNAGVEMSGQGTSGNVVAGDLINSNTSEGVLFDDGASGNWLGMNPADGTANDLTINNGGTVYPLTGNTLYGNDGFGVVFTGAGTSGNVVSGNVINVNAGGGVLINDAASNNFVGVNPVDTAEFGGTFWNVGPTQPQTGDIIYGNSVLGVEISGAGTSGNVIDGDGISNDGSYGVVIENGASQNWIGVNAEGGPEERSKRTNCRTTASTASRSPAQARPGTW